MKKIEILKKSFAIFAIVALSLTMNIFTNNVDAALVAMSISPLSATTVEEGGSLNFTITYTGDVNYISLEKTSFGFTGFNAGISIKESGNNRIVTVSNIRSDGTGRENRIYVTGGTASSKTGNLANYGHTQAFTIKESKPADTVAPVATITGPNPSSIYAGQTVTYIINYSDDIGLEAINLSANSIKLVGFTANIGISGSGNSRIVTLSNVQGSVSSNNYIMVVGGTAIDAAGNLCNSVTGNKFSIIENKKPDDDKPQDNPPQDNPQDKPNTNNNVTNNNVTNNNVTNNYYNERPSDWVENPNTGK